MKWLVNISSRSHSAPFLKFQKTVLNEILAQLLSRTYLLKAQTETLIPVISRAVFENFFLFLGMMIMSAGA